MDHPALLRSFDAVIVNGVETCSDTGGRCFKVLRYGTGRLPVKESLQGNIVVLITAFVSLLLSQDQSPSPGGETRMACGLTMPALWKSLSYRQSS